MMMNSPGYLYVCEMILSLKKYVGTRNETIISLIKSH